MQRKDMVALVAGASVGMAGGAVGALVAWTAGEAALYRFLDQLVDHYIELSQPALSMPRRGELQASLGSAPLAQPTSGPPPPLAMALPNVTEALTSSRTPRR